MSDSTKPTPEIVLTFTPANPGEFLLGVPQRDLTADDLQFIEPAQLRNMTVPGPSGQPMYRYVDAELAAGQVRQISAEKAAPVEPDPPAVPDPPSEPDPPQEPKGPAARRGRSTQEGEG